MLYLALAVGCSLAIGMIFKQAARQGLDRLTLLTSNYAAASGMALLLLWLGGTNAGTGLDLDVRLVALGTATGALFIVGFFLLALATEVAGMSLAIGVMRTSVVVPFLASWLIWSEVPSAAQGVGLIVAGAAFFLIARKERFAAQPAPQPALAGAPDAEPLPTPASPQLSSAAVFGVLAGLFACDGVISVAMKTFDEVFAAENSRALFLMMLFGIAFGIGLVVVVGRGIRVGRWPGRAAVAWGVVLGAVNYGSVEFLLQAIRQLSGPFVFPANNIALVIGAALLGVFAWGETLSRLNWAGLALAAVALLLLNL